MKVYHKCIIKLFNRIQKTLTHTARKSTDIIKDNPLCVQTILNTNKYVKKNIIVFKYQLEN